MYNNDYMYAIERSDDYLAHYGIRGMKWGVRKARKLGLGTARGAKALGKQYAKAQKKLAKLDKAAANSKKYVRRAALMGAGAAAAGGLAAAGTSGVGRLAREAGSAGAQAGRRVGGLMQRVGDAAFRYGRTPGNRNTKLGKLGTRYGKQLSTAGQNLATNSHNVAVAGRRAGTAITTWGKSDSLSRALRRPMITGAVTNGGVVGKGLNRAQGALRGVSNNTIARIGAGAVGAGLAAGAARNAYKAATAKKKAAKFRSEMNKAFAGTKYANGGGSSSSKPRQGKKRRRS